MSESSLDRNDSTLSSIVGLVLASGHRIVNQSREDTPLTTEEKTNVLNHQLIEKPHIFLEKYHRYLNEGCCEYFENCLKTSVSLGDNEKSVINFFLANIQKSSRISNKTRSNRRYHAMIKLMDESTFFTEAQMRHRDPQAYNTMIGQFLSNQELDSIISEPIASLSEEPKSKYDQLLETLDEQLGESSNGRTKEETEKQGYSDEEFDSDSSDDEMDDGKDEFNGDLSESAKELRRREFLLFMQQKFLHGKEKSVDYQEIDSNVGNDLCEEKSRDDEEAWFAGDD